MQEEGSLSRSQPLWCVAQTHQRALHARRMSFTRLAQHTAAAAKARATNGILGMDAARFDQLC